MFSKINSPCIFFIYLFIMPSVSSQTAIFNQLQKETAGKEFVSIQPFGHDALSIADTSGIREFLSKASLLSLSEDAISDIFEERPEYLILNIPLAGGDSMLLKLMQSTPFSSGFKVFKASDRQSPLKLDWGLHYQGIIEGHAHSLAAISISVGEISGFVSTAEGDFVLGKLKKSVGNHIFYNDRDLLIQSNTDCMAEELPMVTNRLNKASIPGEEGKAESTSNCVNIYLEVDHDIYTELGTTQACLSYTASLLNQVKILYANDSIDVGLSEVLIWDVPSPYTCSVSIDCLEQFRDNVGTSFNGDLAHLISYQASGGIAYVDVLCFNSSYYSKAFSSVYTFIDGDVPVYSWDVEVFSHEMGHNLASKHTHACVWNGNNTQIDDCGNLYTTEGQACYNSGSPIIPAAGGTIMSYCHLGTNPGINFSLGFGPQPKALIKSRINGGSCLSSCTEITDTFYCFSIAGDYQYLWLSAFSVDTFSNNSGAQGYSDFTSKEITVMKDSSYSMTITPSFGIYGPIPGRLKVWIDYNGDKDFEDAGEEVYDGGIVNTVKTTSITIPTTATAGKTRLRVSYKNTNSADLDPCENFSFGEVEDYSVVIVDNSESLCSVGSPSLSPVLCLGDSMASITHSTSGATGIGTPTGLPSGINANWSANTIEISGTPIVSGVFNYSIGLIGGTCSGINASGTITINDLPIITCPDAVNGVCLNDSVIDLTTLTPQANPVGGTFSGTGVSGTTFDSGIAGLGTHSIAYNYIDGNGCTNSCNFALTVSDTIAPLAICVANDTFELTTYLNSMEASLLGSGSTDNCTDTLAYSFSSNFTGSSRVFDCDDVYNSPLSIKIYVRDIQQNVDSCVVNSLTVIASEPEICACEWDTITLTNSIPSGLHKAKQVVISTGTVSSVDSATFKAGNTILLQAGFKTQPESYFFAGIDTCTPPEVQGENEVILEEVVQSIDKKVTDSALTRDGKWSNPKAKKPALHLYPNPFSQKTLLEIFLPEAGNYSITIFRMSDGKIIQYFPEKKLNAGISQIKIDGSYFAPGLYLVVVNGTGTVLQQKLVCLPQ